MALRMLIGFVGSRTAGWAAVADAHGSIAPSAISGRFRYRTRSKCLVLSATCGAAGGAEGLLNPDPLIANEVLSQLSYSPAPQGADNAQRPRRKSSEAASLRATAGMCPPRPRGWYQGRR